MAEEVGMGEDGGRPLRRTARKEADFDLRSALVLLQERQELARDAWRLEQDAVPQRLTITRRWTAFAESSRTNKSECQTSGS